MSEKAAQRLQEKWQKHEEALLKKALTDAVTTPEGRALLWWLFTVTHADSTPFQQDPHLTAFMCGQQNVGLRIKAALLDADPAGYVRLLQERANERDARNIQLNDLRISGNYAGSDTLHYGDDDTSDHLN